MFPQKYQLLTFFFRGNETLKHIIEIDKKKILTTNHLSKNLQQNS